ncbi:hypothetical protein ABZ790_08685 [Saccharopolyspora shandongensis]
MARRYDDFEFGQGTGAETLADRYKLSRTDEPFTAAGRTAC